MANVHLSATYSAETLNTLDFARRTKMIKNKALPLVNEEEDDVLKLKEEEIRKLKTKLQKSQVHDFRNAIMCTHSPLSIILLVA